ncbi:MAG: hypothetical protein ABI120_23925, partial [Gemmatimonadaceae bacterium]
MKRLRRTIALCLVVPFIGAVFGACANDANFTQNATSTNFIIASNLYALTGTAPELLAGYEASTNSFVRPLVGQFSGIVNFELAFDIRADGKVLLLPVRSLIPFAPSPSGGAPSVALLKSAQPFDLLTRAPTSAAFVNDSVAVASAGDTFLIKVNTSNCVYGEPLYGKIVIDSVIVAERRMVVRALTNLNCGGYRSLIIGI